MYKPKNRTSPPLNSELDKLQYDLIKKYDYKVLSWGISLAVHIGFLFLLVRPSIVEESFTPPSYISVSLTQEPSKPSFKTIPIPSTSNVTTAPHRQTTPKETKPTSDVNTLEFPGVKALKPTVMASLTNTIEETQIQTSIIPPAETQKSLEPKKSFGKWDLSASISQDVQKLEMNDQMRQYTSCYQAVINVDLSYDQVAMPCLQSAPNNFPTSGYCNLQYDVKTNGKTQNIEALECSDSRLESISIQAVLEWYFIPRVENKKVVTEKNKRTRILFRLKDKYGKFVDCPVNADFQENC